MLQAPLRHDRWFCLAAVVACLALAASIVDADEAGANDPAAATAAAAKDDPPAPRPEPMTETLRGKVVWQAEALRRRFGIETDPDAGEATAAVEIADGPIWPLVRDARGRGFWLDARLRDRELELFVRRYPGSPVVQVIRVYTLRPEGKYELDYWCDICAIPMYELKDCECCQGPTRLRQRRVPPGGEVGVDGDEPTADLLSDPSPPAKTAEKAAEPLP